MEKLTSTVKRKTRYSASLDDSSRSQARQKDSSYSRMLSLKLSTWRKAFSAEVDLFLSKLSKPIISTVEKCILIISPLLFLALKNQ